MKVLIIFCTLIVFQVSSQNEFSRFYVDSLNTSSKGFGLTSDGGAVLLGVNQTNNSQYTKVDSNGEIEWSKTFRFNTMNGQLSEVLQTKDNNYIISGGILANQSGGAFLVKIDLNGDTLWTRRFTDNFSLMEYSNVIETSDSSFILYWRAAYSGSLNAVKVSNTGNVLWTKNLYSIDLNPYLFSCTELKDGSLVFSGIGQSSFGFVNSVVLKMDSNGQIEWYKRYGISNLFEAIYTYGNEFRIVSRTYDNPDDKILFAKFDSLGNNYENFSDTNTQVNYNFESSQFNNRQKINDTIFHATFYNGPSLLPFTITENGIIMNNPLPNFNMNAGSLMTENGQLFQYGKENAGNSNQLRLTKVNLNSSLCSNSFTSYTVQPRATFSHTDVSYTDTSLIHLIPSDVSFGQNSISSYISCESQLSLPDSELFKFILFPNPSNGAITIKTSQIDLFILEIIDLQGRIISSKQTKNGVKNYLVDITSGCYQYQLKSIEGNLLQTGKFILD